MCGSNAGMGVTARLDALRKALPGCSAVVLGDMSADLVLCSSLRDERPQEWLDALCAAGSALLSGPLAGAAGGGVTWAAASSGGGVRMFLRLTEDGADVLCCVCAGDVDISGAIGLAGRALAAIVGRD